MPRQRRETEGKIVKGYCRIRKRGCSSSSSSSLARKCRFKRVILMGKRGGSSTPAPPWRVGSTPPSTEVNIPDFHKHAATRAGGGGWNGKEAAAPISARKLAAGLWEINEVPSPRVKKDSEREKRRGETIARPPLPPHPSDPSQSSHSEIESHRKPTGGMVGARSRLKDVSDGLTTSKQLLKVLNRIWRVEEHYSSSLPLVFALRVELDRAHIQISQLIQEHRSNRNDINSLMSHFAEEKSSWKMKERERIRDLEVEKKLRRQSERLNKRMEEELAETKAALSEAVKELERERRAREVLEEVYDGLARGIGEDRARAEELKRESARVREEVEEEREMLQLADVLREERVQMKLLEAKYQFEEKNAAVEKLRDELETYLGKMCVVNSHHQNENENEDEKLEDNEEGDESGDDSDLHSIELNVDNNSKSYEWSYTRGAKARDESKNVPIVDDALEGRKSSPEKIQWGDISLGRQTSDCGEWDFCAEGRENAEGFNGSGLQWSVLSAKLSEIKGECR